MDKLQRDGELIAGFLGSDKTDNAGLVSAVSELVIACTEAEAVLAYLSCENLTVYQREWVESALESIRGALTKASSEQK